MMDRVRVHGPCHVMRNIPGQVRKGSENSNFQTFAGFSQKHSNKQTDKETSLGNMYWEKRGVISPLNNNGRSREN